MLQCHGSWIGTTWSVGAYRDRRDRNILSPLNCLLFSLATICCLIPFQEWRGITWAKNYRLALVQYVYCVCTLDCSHLPPTCSSLVVNAGGYVDVMQCESTGAKLSQDLFDGPDDVHSDFIQSLWSNPTWTMGVHVQLFSPPGIFNLISSRLPRLWG